MKRHPIELGCVIVEALCSLFAFGGVVGLAAAAPFWIAVAFIPVYLALGVSAGYTAIWMWRESK